MSRQKTVFCDNNHAFAVGTKTIQSSLKIKRNAQKYRKHLKRLCTRYGAHGRGRKTHLKVNEVAIYFDIPDTCQWITSLAKWFLQIRPARRAAP